MFIVANSYNGQKWQTQISFGRTNKHSIGINTRKYRINAFQTRTAIVLFRNGR